MSIPAHATPAAAAAAPRPWAASVARAVAGRGAVYLELSKARLSSLVLMTTAAGYYLARGVDSPSAAPAAGEGIEAGFWRAAAALAGVALVVSGANAFNEWVEWRRDARMRRTCRRPLPTRRVSPREAAAFATLATLAGLALLAAGVNRLTAALALAASLIYVLVYTPLKTRSALCTLAGAIPGALPPLLGWTAATGRVEPGALALFAILFAWQIPHFLALAWLYREDYERGGFRMLPVVDPGGGMTSRLALLWTLALLPLTLSLAAMGHAGYYYAAGAALLGGAFLAAGWRLYRSRTAVEARRLFLASVIYLPLLLALMVADRAPASAPASAPAASPRVSVAFAPAGALAAPGGEFRSPIPLAASSTPLDF